MLIMGWWYLSARNYDTFNTDFDKIYRMEESGVYNGRRGDDFSLSPLVAPLLQKEYPDVEDMVRVSYVGRTVCRTDHYLQYENKIVLADPTFFTFFTYKLKKGNASDCLSSPNSLVISEAFAQRYFSSEDPIGKTLRLSIEGRDLTLKVSAVMENMPKNSHLQLDAIAPLSLNPRLKNFSGLMGMDRFFSYVKLAPSTNLKHLSKAFQSTAFQVDPELKEYDTIYSFRPLKEMYYHKGSKVRRTVSLLMLLAFSILVLSCFNFSNLYIADCFGRVKTLGVRKSLGASRPQLVALFFKEVVLYTCIAMFFALWLSYILLPLVNQLFGIRLVYELFNIRNLSLIISLIVGASLLAVVYPAIYLTRFKPNELLLGHFRLRSVSFLQRCFVVVQFFISLVLLICVAHFKEQISYVNNKSLGLDLNHVVYFEAKGNLAKSYQTIKQKLASDPNVLLVSAKSSLPTEWNDGAFIALPSDPDADVHTELSFVKPNYFQLLDIPLEGRTFKASESNGLILNEAAVDKLGLKSPLGKQVLFKGQSLSIVGVTANVNTKALRNRVHPEIYLNMRQLEGVVMIKTNGQDKEVKNFVKQLWLKENPDYPFEASTLQQAYKDQYSIENTISDMSVWVMLISYLISLVGLFALAKYSTELRTKEIGVRITNGASKRQVVYLLNKEFVVLLVIAYALAVPAGYKLSEFLLSQFAYHIPIQWGVIVLAGILSIGVAVLTVSIQSYRVANSNPVQALRYE